MAGSPAEVAALCDFVIVMVTDSEAVREVVAGEGGVLDGVRDGALVIDMSTISPDTERDLDARLRHKGARLVDAPVSGGDVGARKGTLAIMAGGDSESFEQARPSL